MSFVASKRVTVAATSAKSVINQNYAPNKTVYFREVFKLYSVAKRMLNGVYSSRQIAVVDQIENT